MSNEKEFYSSLEDIKNENLIQKIMINIMKYLIQTIILKFGQ